MTEISDQVILANDDLERLLDRHEIPAAYRQRSCELVSPGEFRVVRASQGFLSSFLGAGVGVALFDAQAGVGGLIHFLLTEPVGRSSARHPQRYVQSGLQVFIDELLEAGAQETRLQATVAGGILIGQPREQAQELGSWQQTAVLVLQQLKQARIKINQAEVGGTTPCSLLLDTDRWQVSVKLFCGSPLSASLKPPAKPSVVTILNAISRVKPIPQVAITILQLLGDETGARVDNLAEEIKKDQVIAAKVLRFCNSPAFGFSQEIASIDRAVVLLGENNLTEIVISAAVDLLYSDQDQGYALMKGALYRHAQATAQISKEITFFTGCIDPGLAYTAGLLHDIGKVVLDSFVANSLPFFYQRMAQQGGEISTLEKQLFDINHMEVGAQLASQWNLPESLACVIQYHHAPDKAPLNHRMLVFITYLADLLACRYLAGIELEKMSDAPLLDSLAAVGLRPSQLPLIIDNIPWKNLLQS